MRGRTRYRAGARRRFLPALVAATFLATGLAASSSAAPAANALQINVLSNRADLISGGDALVEVVLPKGTNASNVKVNLGRRDITRSFASRSRLKGAGGGKRFLGLVKGLALGRNLLRARLGDGTATEMTITNHPIGGPVFSGPQIQPWACAAGARDKQCNRPPIYTFVYKPALSLDCFWLLGNINGCDYQSYDPNNPPSPESIAQTTTDQGVTVPYIVRVETGTIDRDQYKIAVLFDPKGTWAPWAPQKSWNHKLVITGGAGCNITYAEGTAPDVTQDTALSRGFAVMSNALDNAGHNCSPVTEAESLMMTNEHFVEGYGEIRYTIGTGCSGGSEVQNQAANAYPGIWQGLTTACTFADGWTTRSLHMLDETLISRYLNDPTQWGTGVAWTPTARAAVIGRPGPIAMGETDKFDPSRGGSCPGVASSDVYDARTNPRGVRCTFQDYMISVFGRRPRSDWGPVEKKLGHGFANRPLDNVGVQYGLRALLAGDITPAQFVDLNAKFGSYDIDLNWQPARAVADPAALPTAYRGGPINTASNLDQVAIIDVRGPGGEVPGEGGHDVHRTYVVRARLVREHGTADNQILWRGPAPLFGDVRYENEAIVAMDKWLAAVEADHRNTPLARKIIKDRPKSITDRCTDGTGLAVPAAFCDAVVKVYSTPRMVAGMPFTEDVMKCQLKPFRRSDYYPILFTDDEWSSLQNTFPTGVCDYSKPGVGYQKTFRWGATFGDGPGGRPLGPPPSSRLVSGRGT